MAHKAQFDFVAEVKGLFPEFFSNQRVLEVGSWDVNGSVRQFFEGCDYTGIDVAPGKGVDVVCQGQDFDSKRPFDVAISCECFEHNPFWKATFRNMVRLCRGLVLVTCAAPGRKEHGSLRRGPKFSLSSKLFGKYYENVCAEDLLAAGAEAWPRFDRCVLHTVGTDLQFYGVLK